MKKLQKVFRAATVAVAVLALSCATATAEHLTILTTNDTHSCIEPNQDNLGGLLRRKVIMDSVRAADRNVLAVDAGDIVQGTVYFSMFRGDVEYAALDSLGYDICIMGNHEFDNGMADIAKYYKRLPAVKLSSNYDVADTPLNGVFQPYVIKHCGGKSIAFIGINLVPKGMIADKNTEGLIYHNGTGVALRLSQYLKEAGLADYVVMVSHIGHTGRKGSLSDTEIVRQSRHIDLVIGGHSHTLVDPSNNNPRDPHLVANAEGRLIPICQDGGQGEHIGKIDFDTETGQATFSLITVDAAYDKRAAEPRYAAMRAWLEPYTSQVYKKMHTRIATSAQAMEKTDPSLGNWVCDAVVAIGKQMYGPEVEFALMNRGGIRQPMPQGNVTEGDIEAMLPFDNRLVVIKILGSDLMRVIRSLAARGGDAVSKAVDVEFAADGTVTSAKINGKKIRDLKYYTLITIDYLANGGSRMGDLKRGQVLMQDTEPYGKHVIEYVKRQDAQGQQIVADNTRRMRQSDR